MYLRRTPSVLKRMAKERKIKKMVEHLNFISQTYETCIPHIQYLTTLELLDIHIREKIYIFHFTTGNITK